ncbi:MAG: hypothetical protein EBS93_10195, partial [Chitinophagia bacterium]|nr:hypothetical protein [Chitinophagia bacterium]
QNKINRKIQSANRNQIKNIPLQSPAKKPSLQRVIMGEIYDWQNLENNQNSQRTAVGTSTLWQSSIEMIYDYDKKAYMSFDGFFGPVSVSGAGGLPRFAQYNLDTNRQSLSKNPHPPFIKNNKSINNLKINRDYLNPLTNSFNSGNHHHDGSGVGHVIDLVGRETGVPQSGIMTSLYGIASSGRYSEDYRFLATRGPLVLHSWGYDIEGKPIPNQSDIELNTKSGIFTENNLTDNFLSNWLSKPSTWPVAPVDLRFDRNRGVWVAPQTTRIITATLDEKLQANSSGQASIIFDTSIYDSSGQTINDAKITVYEKLGGCYPSGTKIHSYYNTSLNQYIVLEATIGCDFCKPSNNDEAFTIGRLDLKSIPGWNVTKQQVLTHNSGCLVWIDTTACPSG